jgi:pilus assembly protein CpaB
MNPKIWIPLTAAALTGSAAAWTGYQLISYEPAPTAVTPVLMDDVVVAARPIAAGTELTSDDLAVVRVEQGSISGMLSSASAALGRVTSEAIAQGQPVSASLFAEEGTTPGIAAALPKGFRALTLQMDPHNGLAGFLIPEARVDIISALGSGDAATARAIAQNVRVLAVAGRVRGQKIETTGEDAALLGNRYSVTLMVTIEQAAAIELALDTGMPRLALRASGDQDIQPFAGLTMAQLRGEVFGDPWETAQTLPVAADPLPINPATQPSDTSTTPPTEIKPRTRTHVVEVIRGGVVSRTEMPARTSPTTERGVVNNEPKPAGQ